MSTLVVPNIGSKKILDFVLDRTLTLRLYSNDVSPGLTTVAADLEEVTGGGYSEVDLEFNRWDVTQGNPSIGLYDDYITFLFTGVTGDGGEVYGYYVIDEDGNLMWAQYFDVAPFTPIAGAIIKVRPRFTGRNQI